jgi:hypothetical protein
MAKTTSRAGLQCVVGAVTDEGLARAMKKAVALGLAPKQASLDDYTKWWGGMKACIEAAINDDCPNANLTGKQKPEKEVTNV